MRIIWPFKLNIDGLDCFIRGVHSCWKIRVLCNGSMPRTDEYTEDSQFKMTMCGDQKGWFSSFLWLFFKTQFGLEGDINISK